VIEASVASSSTLSKESKPEKDIRMNNVYIDPQPTPPQGFFIAASPPPIPILTISESSKPMITMSTSQEVRSVLTLTPEFKIRFTCSIPSRWIRFWQWALLGWKWESK
jgi:hypothetical protein